MSNQADLAYLELMEAETREQEAYEAFRADPDDAAKAASWEAAKDEVRTVRARRIDALIWEQASSVA